MMLNRKFIPGTEWGYLKIYTGVKTSDIILEEMIKPVVEHFQENNFISKWFFIRYHDPKHHIRVRFKIANLDNYDKILKSIKDELKGCIDSGEIANIVFDTYNRELERYGENTVEIAEELFCKSSELVLNFLEYDDEEKIIVSLFYIDQLLNAINVSDSKKIEWISGYNIAFKKEFNADKNLNRQLDKKFRLFKPKYLEFIKSKEFKQIRDQIILNIQGANNLIESITENNQNLVSEFFQSIFHMHINRMFISNQRLFEMIIYDYLFRHYKTTFNIHHSN